MKEDAPPPPLPPVKRRHLERCPDYWLAVWANNEELPEKHRKRAQEERDRRKAATPDRVVGILVDREDVTPPQLALLKERVVAMQATAIEHIWAPRRVAVACRSFGLPVTSHPEMRDVVLNSDIVIAAPRCPEYVGSRTPVWEAVHYARHRKLPVIVILPTGELV